MPDPNDFMHAQMAQGQGAGSATIPPQAMAALQQSGASGENLTQILAQLATMSPDQVSAALAQLGINVDPDTLHSMAEQWVDDGASKLAGSGSAGDGDDGEQQPTAAADEGDAESPSPAESASAAPTQDDEAAEPAPDNEQAEGENAMAAASPEDVAAAQQQMQGGGRGMPTRGGGGNIDAAISAMMGAGGARGGAMPRPSAMPMPGPAAGEDPRAKSMIANIYRQQMGPGSGSAASRIGIPLGPRTGGGPGETASPLTRMKKPKKQ